MNYYRKSINKDANDIKLKTQLGALTLKISENNNKIDSLLEVDKNIIKDVSSNSLKIDSYIKAIELINKNTSNNSKDISDNLTKIKELKSDLSNINYNSTMKLFNREFFYL